MDSDQTMRIGNRLICMDYVEDLDEAFDEMKRRLKRCAQTLPAAT
jgi:hypothetical protein